MNNKVSRIQIGMMLAFICSSLYLGIGDIILLRKSGNEVLVSMIVGTVLGFIPVLMYLKVNSCLPNLNIYKKNIKMFGNAFGNILNFLFFLIYVIMFTIASRSIVIFITSKYLHDTPFFFVGLLVIITCLIVCFKGIETIARVSQLTFIASVLIILLVETFLIQYIDIKNILPIFIENNYLSNVLDGAVYFAASSSLLTMLLLTINKSKINEPEKYNKTIIIFYLISTISLTIVMFFVVSCFGYNMATLFRYPEYILLKKIGTANAELHLENFLAFRWIFYMLSLSFISLYGIINGVKNYFKKPKVRYIMTAVIALISMFVAKMAFGNIPNSVILIKKYYVMFIALPMFIILTIMFIKSFFIKN